jgi:hypothetical protein
MSFLAVRPVINSNYEGVKAEAEIWIFESASHPVAHGYNYNTDICGFSRSKMNSDQSVYRRIAKTNFALFVAIAAPGADKNSLRTICDWGNWVC